MLYGALVATLCDRRALKNSVHALNGIWSLIALHDLIHIRKSNTHYHAKCSRNEKPFARLAGQIPTPLPSKNFFLKFFDNWLSLMGTPITTVDQGYAPFGRAAFVHIGLKRH